MSSGIVLLFQRFKDIHFLCGFDFIKQSHSSYFSQTFGLISYHEVVGNWGYRGCKSERYLPDFFTSAVNFSHTCTYTHVCQICYTKTSLFSNISIVFVHESEARMSLLCQKHKVWRYSILLFFHFCCCIRPFWFFIFLFSKQKMSFALFLDVILLV